MAFTSTPALKSGQPAFVRKRKLAVEPKIALTIFVAVLTPIYFIHPDYGAKNFLYFCDIALLLTCIGLWLENRLLLSMQLVGILTIQIIWTVDYLGHFVLGNCPFGLAGYAFTRAPIVHFLTLFHVWLPLLLFWAVWRLGYDRRAWLLQTLFVCPWLVLSVYLSNPTFDLNFSVSYLGLSMDRILEGRLPGWLNFIYEGFHSYTEWRLSLGLDWARAIGTFDGMIFMALCLLLPAHLLLILCCEKKRAISPPREGIAATAPRGIGTRIRRLFWGRPNPVVWTNKV
jgi:hypothetical protein